MTNEMLALHLLAVATLMLAPLLAHADDPADALVGEDDGMTNEILVGDDVDDTIRKDTGKESVVENTGNIFIDKAADASATCDYLMQTCTTGNAGSTARCQHAYANCKLLCEQSPEHEGCATILQQKLDHPVDINQ